MPPALRLPCLCLSWLLALPAHAQMYKCTDGDSTTYSEAPCERGAQTVLAPPPAPSTPSAAGELKRLQKESAALQQAREQREARQERADALHDRQAARRRESCAKLDLARRWADDDVRHASHGTADAARLKARRAAERHAAECR